jgi:hypothetical protein
MASIRYRQISTEFLPQDLSRNLAMLRVEPEQIIKRTGIQFRETYDDLDYLRLAVIHTSSKKVFALTRYLHSPAEGVVIHSSRNSKTLVEDLREILKILRVRHDEVSWLNPDIRSELANFNNANPVQSVKVTFTSIEASSHIKRMRHRRKTYVVYEGQTTRSPSGKYIHRNGTNRNARKISANEVWDLKSVVNLITV